MAPQLLRAGFDHGPISRRSRIAFVAMPKRLHACCVDPKPPLDMEQFAPKNLFKVSKPDLRDGIAPAIASNGPVLSDYGS